MKALYNLNDNIYWLTFEKGYDLCMSFWRVAEMKESPNPDMVAGKMNLIDYMEWYAEKYGKGAFTYAADWRGYNQTREDLEKVYPLFTGVMRAATGLIRLKDPNKYDNFMIDLYRWLDTICIGKKFYLIGTVEGDYETLEHEYAHALWGMNPEYNKAQQDNINALDDETNVVLCSNLTEMGYGGDVHEDEIQAYLSTGWELKKVVDLFHRPISPKQMKSISAPFEKVFKKFSLNKVPRKGM